MRDPIIFQFSIQEMMMMMILLPLLPPLDGGDGEGVVGVGDLPRMAPGRW